MKPLTMTNAELAVLSLVADGLQHGYQIQQAIEVRGVREWANIGNSSVYYILNKLDHDGLLSSDLEPSTRGPARKIFTLTAAGHGVLQTAIADLLSTPEQNSSFVLGLANLHVLRPDQIRHALDSYESTLRSRIADLNAQQQDTPPQTGQAALYRLAMFDYSLRIALAELAWIQEFRQAWEAQAPPAPPRQNPMRTPVIRSAPTVQLSDTKPGLPAEDDPNDASGR